jgi:hypothetical protein
MRTVAADILEDPCKSEGELSYVCGLMNAEDIVSVGDTGWLIASSVDPYGAPPGPGRLYLINVKARTARAAFPGSRPDLRPDKTLYPSCPGIKLDAFDTHGLSLRETAEAGVYRLYATSHGGIEAVEAFSVDARGAGAPKITWVGCVPLPSGVFANAVAILPDGGFVTTKFLDPSDPDWKAKIGKGQETGAVYQWRPGGAVSVIPGTGASGPNGIEVSPDGLHLFVAATGGHEVVRYDLRGMTAKVVTPLPIAPDNLRWTATGDLLVVGARHADAATCTTEQCSVGWAVYRIRPETMKADQVVAVGAGKKIAVASTALQVGDEIWIGQPSGDRVGVLRAP